jgi:2-polyprenyl-6-methoxyphenol hydroxylase-like FAD-dependent oxidoreductase
LSISEEETIRILTDKLAKLGGAVERGVEFATFHQNEQHVRATLKGQECGEHYLEASLVVGADGYHSAVRNSIAVEFERRDYTELWGVCDTDLSNWNHGRDAVCAQLAPPIVIPIPLGERLWRVYFWADTPDSDVLSLVVKRLRVVSPKVDLVNPSEPQFFHSHSREISKLVMESDATQRCFAG